MNTMFLAAVMGWFLVIISILLFFRYQYMKPIIKDVLAYPGLFFVLAIMTFILGLLMVVSHNVWVMGWPVVVTLLSWLVLISGIVRLAFPDRVIRLGRSHVLNHPLRVPIIGAVLLLIGLFLLVHVYYLHY